MACKKNSRSPSLCKSVLERIFGSANYYCGRRRRRGRNFNRDDVESAEEFQDAASTLCLSSYYSVFVVRLAIMVCDFSFLELFPIIISSIYQIVFVLVVLKEILKIEDS